jgi:hypothetical protein
LEALKSESKIAFDGFVEEIEVMNKQIEEVH